MYDLPDQAAEGAQYVIDATAIEQCKPLSELAKPRKESA